MPNKKHIRIVTWNCSGAFRKKYEAISLLEPDICVVQECENPELVDDAQFKSWFSDFRWVGKNRHKGLCIFALNDQQLGSLDCITTDLRFFLSCRVNSDIALIGVWACRGAGKQDSYIGQVWKFVQANIESFSDEKFLIAGDFNSNKIWDQERSVGNHSDVVQSLAKVGISSIYHAQRNEPHGEETEPTFFLYRKLDRPYHIDYIFGSIEIVERTVSFETGDPALWLRLSDHLPLVVDLKIATSSNQFQSQA